MPQRHMQSRSESIADVIARAFFCVMLLPEELLIEFDDTTATQQKAARGVISQARMSRLTYLGMCKRWRCGATVRCSASIGNSIADLVARAVLGLKIWAMASTRRGNCRSARGCTSFDQPGPHVFDLPRRAHHQERGHCRCHRTIHGDLMFHRR